MLLVGVSLFATIFAFELFEWLAANKYEKSFIDDRCLRCICAASSNCQPNARCRVIEPDAYLCGPFRLSEDYWFASGARLPSSVKLKNNPLAFEMCALDLQCSIETVSQLLNTFLTRCNIDEAQWNPNIKCMLSAFVHYRAIYLSWEEPDDFDYFEPHEYHHLGPRQTIFGCDVNATNLIQRVEHIQWLAPATRSDDNYWSRFMECSEEKDFI